MELYKLKKPLFLTESTAQRIGALNRLMQAGETAELPDDVAKVLLKRNSIELVELEKETPVTRPAAKKTVAKKEVNK